MLTGEAEDDLVTEMLTRVKQKGIEKRDILNDDEFKSIVSEVRDAAA